MPGEVSERLKERDWKSRGRLTLPRGFESLPLRFCPDSDGGELRHDDSRAVSLPDVLLLAGACLLFAYAAVVATLALAGRRAQARALGGFVPDCAILFARLARDPAVPRRRRLALVAVAAYLASPIDLVPDFLPVAGQADDALLVALALRWLVRGAGPALLERHWPGPDRSLAVLLRLAGASRREA
jgi:uncharacterized membrane protein YkvA (DUF1232 family)